MIFKISRFWTYLGHVCPHFAQITIKSRFLLHIVPKRIGSYEHVKITPELQVKVKVQFEVNFPRFFLS